MTQKKRCDPVNQEGESMSFLLKKGAILELILALFYPVRNLSKTCPKPVRNPPETCPFSILKKCSLAVLNLSETRPKPVRNLSAQNRKKRTTPFGGMARPYYSLPTPLFHSFSSLSLISHLLSLFPLKFSKECSR